MVVSSASVVCRHTIFVYFSTTGIDALVKGQGRCGVFLGVLCSRDIVREQNICALIYGEASCECRPCHTEYI